MESNNRENGDSPLGSDQNSLSEDMAFKLRPEESKHCMLLLNEKLKK